ncbi:hypothetical protein GC207_02435 [bacterium]|nr:hypothetical protein [bacterium]
MPASTQLDFDGDFERAIADWRERHKLPEEDAVLLLIELFRIHQQHWDELRRREIPSFDSFRADLTQLAETMRTFQGQSAALLDLLKKLPSTHLAARITRTAAFFAALTSLLAGYLFGRAWP